VVRGNGASGTTKAHAARSVAVSASVLKILAPAMVGKAPDELLWCRGDGSPLRPPTTTHWFGAAVKRCQAADNKFPRGTVHELRHTATSLMIASGANVKTVQAQLGHKTATMTLDRMCPQRRQARANNTLACFTSVELPGIEPGSYGIPSRLLRAQSAMPLLGSPDHANKSG
jgi:Phage integrase family